MKQHKWHQEIKAWADGAEIEYKNIKDKEWSPSKAPHWWNDAIEYRIKPHKWEKEISAWENGLEIQGRLGLSRWIDIGAYTPQWDDGLWEYRIKPQDICKCQKQTCSALKEPQYLYVYKTKKGIELSLDYTGYTKDEYIGEIKLEVDDAD